MNNQQLSTLALIHACNARVLGMEAENQTQVLNGREPTYSEWHFQEEAQTLDMLSTQALNLPE